MPTQKTVENVCNWCGTDFERRYNQRFCSRSCSAKHQHSDTDAPAAAGNGISERRRAKILKRDDQSCQSCGVLVGKQSDDVPTAEVHHLIPTSAGGSHHGLNLITLCQSCHQDIHKRMKRMYREHPELLGAFRAIITGDGDQVTIEVKGDA